MLSLRIHTGPCPSQPVGRRPLRPSLSSSDARRRGLGNSSFAAKANSSSSDDADVESPTTSSSSSFYSSSTSTSTPPPRRSSRVPRVAVIGGGWAGFGAAKALVEQGYDVSLLDAAPGAGASAAWWRTKTGRSMEAGIKGMWYDYPNIDACLLELGISDCLTPYTTSGFWAAPGRKVGGLLSGRVSNSSSPSSSAAAATLINQAPVFSSLPQLPTPLGQAFHTRDYFKTLSLLDRASVLPIVAAAADVRSSPERHAALDKMTARELFKKIGATEAVYRDFLEPTLLVALFAPPEQLSAAETLNALYYYALKTQSSFDVRWCRGSIAERIFAPLAERIRESGGQIYGGTAVEEVGVDEKTNSITSLVAKETATGKNIEIADLEAVVFAMGVKGMQSLVLNNPEALGTRDEFSRTMNLKTIDCVSVRLWFDSARKTRFPANVLSGFDGDATGGTFFNLNQIQDEYMKPGAEGCVSSDYYGASALLPLPDHVLVKRARANLEACEPAAFRDARLVDSCVARARGAVTAFSAGSLASRPRQETSFANAFVAGDWVRGVEDKISAEGLSQERALATGLTAAGLVIGRCGLGRAPVVLRGLKDEPHIAAAKGAAAAARAAAAALGLRSPFLP